MSVTAQPRAWLKHIVTFSRLSLPSQELSVMCQWQALLCIRVRIVCMSVRGNKTCVLYYRWFDFGADDTFWRAWKPVFFLPAKSSDILTENASKEEHQRDSMQKSTEIKPSKSLILCTIDFSTSLCLSQFYCSTVSVEAPCVLVLHFCLPQKLVQLPCLSRDSLSYRDLSEKALSSSDK